MQNPYEIDLNIIYKLSIENPPKNLVKIKTKDHMDKTHYSCLNKKRRWEDMTQELVNLDISNRKRKYENI